MMSAGDACTDADAAALVAERELRVFAGVDASTKRDSTAIVACSYDRKLKKVRLIWHRVFLQPSPSQPLDFEGTVEASLRQLAPAPPTARGPLRSVPDAGGAAQRLTAAAPADGRVSAVDPEPDRIRARTSRN